MGWHQTEKAFFTVKETIDKIKRLPTEQKKVFANDISDKESISQIYKEFTQLNIKKKNRSSHCGSVITNPTDIHEGGRWGPSLSRWVGDLAFL